MLNFIITVNNIEYDAVNDLHCFPMKFHIGDAEVQLEKTEVPFRDGALYFSQYFGMTAYRERRLSFPILIIDEDEMSVYNRVDQLFNGKQVKIKLSNDNGFYYDGVCYVRKLNSEDFQWQFTLEADVHPYKQRDMSINLPANEEQSITVGINGIIPTVTATSATTITQHIPSLQQTRTISFESGTSQNIDFTLVAGENIISADKAVEISYTERSL